MRCYRTLYKKRGVTLSTTAVNEHVSHIEIQIKMVKERVRSTWNSLPYKKFPNRMISRMVENVVFWINALPVNRCMSCAVSPHTLMTGTTVDFNKH